MGYDTSPDISVLDGMGFQWHVVGMRVQSGDEHVGELRCERTYEETPIRTAGTAVWNCQSPASCTRAPSERNKASNRRLIPEDIFSCRNCLYKTDTGRTHSHLN